MPRFFGSADEEELARRRAVGDMRGTTGGMGPALNRGQYFAYGSNAAGQVTTPVFTNAPQAQAFAQSAGTGVRQVSPDAPAQPRYFGSNIAPIRNSAPGRTPTMFSNVPGDRSLLERDMMQSARGSGASRRALMAERQRYDSGMAERERLDRAARKIDDEREHERDIATIRGPETAGVRTQGALDVQDKKTEGALDVQKLKGTQVLAQLTQKQRGDIDAITAKHKLNKEAIRLRADLDFTGKSALLAQSNAEELEEIRERLGADVALAVAMKKIEAGVTETQKKTVDAEKGITTVNKDTSFSTPEGLPGQGEQGMAEQGVDADQNGVDDNAKWSDPASGETLNMNDIANFVTKFQAIEKSKPSSWWLHVYRAQYLVDSKRLQAWLKERTSAAPTTQGQ